MSIPCVSSVVALVCAFSSVEALSRRRMRSRRRTAACLSPSGPPRASPTGASPLLPRPCLARRRRGPPGCSNTSADRAWRPCGSRRMARRREASPPCSRPTSPSCSKAKAHRRRLPKSQLHHPRHLPGLLRAGHRRMCPTMTPGPGPGGSWMCQKSNSGTKPELSRHGGHGWRQGVAQIAGCPPSVTPRGRFRRGNRVVPRKPAGRAIARGRRRGGRGRELGFLPSSISHLGIASDYQSNFAGQLGIRAGSAGETLGRPVKAASPDFKMNRGLAARP